MFQCNTLEHKVNMCTCEHCLVLRQILEKVSPNPAGAKTVAAQGNHQKNRSMEFLPGISPAGFTTALSHDCVHCAQWTDGVWV